MNPSIESTSMGRSQVMVLPVKQRPHFPGFYKAMMIKDKQVVAGIKANLAQGKAFVATFLTKSEDFKGHVVCQPDDIYRVGSLSQVLNIMPGPNGSMTVLMYAHKRVSINTLILPEVTAAATAEKSDDAEDEDEDNDTDHSDEKPEEVKDTATKSEETDINDKSLPYAFVSSLKEEPFDKKSKILHNLVTDTMNALNEIVRLNPLVRDQMAEFMRSATTMDSMFNEPGKIADFAAAMSETDPQSLQDILECTNVEERLRRALVLLRKEKANAELQHSISQDIQKQIGTKDHEKYLNERLSGIRKELGLETVARDKILDKFKARAKLLVMPDSIKTVFDEEMGKMQHLKPSSQEYNLTQTYLDWLTMVPWGKFSKETYELDHAQRILDEDHFGLKDVKDRIMEFIAVAKMRGSVEGKIICLVGPPGVGKTSIGKSIARSLNREFFRFSVGGLYDVAEIKGHRRTYVGAMPGKLVQALKKVQTSNPMILIDEIDKIGQGSHSGDPSAALLEVLDPEQNSTFMDHYMDVSMDLSKVLFVCTANLTDTIPGPLMDRMEVITLSGYVADEKRQIAQNYLIPQVRQASGLTEDQVVVTDDSINELIHHYCRENGVRNLKKKIEQVFRKAALMVVEEGSDAKKPITISRDNLKKFVGYPVFTSDRLYQTTPEGVVMGLAYSSYGGATLYIETVLDSPLTSDSRASFHHTGNLGSVMKESSGIARSYARHYLKTAVPGNDFFDKASIHLHVPEGATPKDGPSAGIAMCTALVSLALKKPIKPDFAMTGELTLTGKVLKIGGVKEKVMAAKRSNVKEIILPASNQADFEDLAENIREGIMPHFVNVYDDVFKVVFDHSEST